MVNMINSRPFVKFYFICYILIPKPKHNMPSKSSTQSKKKTTRKTSKKSAGSSFLHNPVDPMNQYPNYLTGKDEYGPPPPFGINEHDTFNMKPFNPNVVNSIFGGPIVHPPQVGPSPVTYSQGLGGMGGILMPPAYNMLGLPNPAAPIVKPMTPKVPKLKSNTSAPAVLPALPNPGQFSLFPPYGFDTIQPQYINPSDPNNQFPHPITGSLTEPGPSLAGCMNAFDPYNVIGAPQGTPGQMLDMRARMASQPQHPQAPYHFMG